MNRHLSAAAGYLELGMYEDALDEMEKIPAEQREQAMVLMVHLEIFMAMKQYEGMAEVAEKLTKIFPSNPEYWVNLAYAQRRSQGMGVAEKTLVEALRLFPSDATIHFNLACYACQLGRNQEAKERLGKAIEIDPSFKLMALDDEDLAPLWD